MTWNLNDLDSRFSLPDKEKAVFSKGEMVGAREGKTGGLGCVRVLYK